MRLTSFHITRLLIAMLLFCFKSNAQQLAFHHLTVENGLSQNAVLAIGQDNQGFIWIGTYNGLNKYLPGPDRFKRILSPSNSVITYHCLYEDRKGNIWAGTNAGLYRVNTEKGDKPELVEFAPTGSSGDRGVRAILEDRSGDFWIGTTMGLFRIRKSGNQTETKHFQHNPQDATSISSDFITAIEEDRQGRIWVGTHINGVNQYDSRTGVFKRFTHQPGGKSIINNNIRKLLIDKESRMWIGTQEGISVLDEQGNNLYSFQQNDGDAESLSQNSVY
ncbi:MAG: hypothetical protein EOO04_37785, partial [Chitinophagaceae bacterium]